MSVCLLDMTASHRKTDEPIETPLGLCSRVGPKNCIGWGLGSPRGGTILGRPCDASFLQLPLTTRYDYLSSSSVDDLYAPCFAVIVFFNLFFCIMMHAITLLCVKDSQL